MPTVAECASAVAAKRKPVVEGYTPANAKVFRASPAWRRVRFAVLAANAKRNDGVPRCELCNRSRRDRQADGSAVVLDVDHCEPISRGGWDYRFEASRCQVLCSICNRDGKGNRSSDDFRPVEPAA